MKLGIIGGSGLYEMDGMTGVRERSLTTPFGTPSDPYVCGQLGECEVFFLPRHGRGHRILPSELNHRANIYGFKMLGVDRVVSFSAVGSLREELGVRDVVLPDQYFDRTKTSSRQTFFGEGLVAHVSFGDPVCGALGDIVEAAVRAELTSDPAQAGVKMHRGGTYVNMEGPAFSTRAESNYYRQFGFDVIGMTSLAEAKLCREAEICYQPVAMVTDYDCWHVAEEPVTVEMILGHLAANVALAKKIVRRLATARFPTPRACACAGALQYAIATAPAAVPPAVRRRFQLLTGKYLPVS